MNDREYIQKLKKHHMCVKCKKQDAYTLAGRSYCCECAEYKRKWQETNYKQNHEKILSRKREKRLECINNNICSRCLQRKTDGVYKVCNVCRRKWNAKRRAKTTYTSGVVCYHCHKPLDGQIKVNGKPSKLCSSCYNKTVELALKNVQQMVENKERLI